MFIAEPGRQTRVAAEVDVIVLGGGPSGIAAAAAAARRGADTILVERYGFLGGMGTIAGVTNFCGLHVLEDGRPKRVVHGIVDEILDRLAKRDALAAPHIVLGKTAAQAYDNAAYKCVAEEAVTGAGARLELHQLAVGVTMVGERIDALVTESKSGRRAFRATTFIDCSGDADLAAWAGAPYEKGDADGALAYPTLMFRLGHVDDARALAEGKPNIRRILQEVEAREGVLFPRRSAWINPQPHAGEWRANVTQIGRGGRAVDGTNSDDLTWGEQEGRRQVALYFEFLTKHVPGFESAYLLEIAPQLGIRETRRIVGRYVLTADDVLGARSFDDGIGVNPWPMEEHIAGDVNWRFPKGRGFHDVPFSALVPQGVTNLLVAGRCASATHEAQGSLRVSGPCFVMGEAAGVAAALATNESPAPAIHAARLRASLRESGTWFVD